MRPGKGCALPPYAVLPPPLVEYLNPNNVHHALFMRHIRTLNGAFAFTSLGVTRQRVPGRGPPNFIISGQLYHRIGPHQPDSGRAGQEQFAQVYILDGADQDQVRDRNLFRTLTEGRRVSDPEFQTVRRICFVLGAMLNICNPFVRHFAFAGQIIREANNRGEPIPDVVLRLQAPGADAPATVRATANLLTSSEVALIMTGAGEPHEPTVRDIRVYARSGLRSISHLQAMYTPLQFPLLFPLGDPGFTLGIGYHVPPPADQ
jgi:hypothetical protein